MSKGGEVRYKCRQCGEEYTSCHAPDVAHALQCAVFDFMVQPTSWGGLTVHAVDVHQCRTGVWGVSDIIGGIEDKQ
jgi:hypothetical protein